MNYRLICRLLGILSFFFGLFMVFSMPWAHSSLGRHTHPKQVSAGTADSAEFTEVIDPDFEYRGFRALVGSSMICLGLGALLMMIGRKTKSTIYRKEAMAVVGLSWVLATFLGALPFLLAGVIRGPSVRIYENDSVALVADTAIYDYNAWIDISSTLSDKQFRVLKSIVESGSTGISGKQLRKISGDPDAPSTFESLFQIPALKPWLISPSDSENSSADRIDKFRLRWVPMTIADCLFESQSGFSTTGATVLSELEDPNLVPHCILFWRSSMHFLGGLGIIVLFVAVLGQGSSGKALMRAEMPGPSKDGSTARMQHTAWLFAIIYVGLNVLLSVLLWLLGMTWFDAICHAFGTMATGGFSTYNASLGHFDSSVIEYLVTVFMILAGTNFTLLYFLALWQPLKLIKDVEWQAYLGIIVVATVVIIIAGMSSRNEGFESISSALRYSLFQVVSVMTTTGYGTNDFDQWNQLSRAILIVLMFVGGCAGSTGGGMKVIRHVLMVKILKLEVEKSFHPRLIRPLRIGQQNLEDSGMRTGILVYFGLVFVIFVGSWLILIGVEPNSTWAVDVNNKLVDSGSAVAATLHNIGPGLGTVGATQNYGHFTSFSKCLFTVLMMLGRLEIFPLVVLTSLRFWRR